MRSNLLILALFAMLIMGLGIVKSRSQIISSGNKIIKLQKELWDLNDTNDKLRNEYSRIATADNIVKKNKELALGLVPPSEMICLEEDSEQNRTVSMQIKENAYSR